MDILEEEVKAMTNRVTDAQLEAIVERINRATGSPLESWTRGEDGKLRANVGNYHLYGAYGGTGLHRMMNESGGVTTPITGLHTKRELAERMWAFLSGLEAGRAA